jgi:predicted ATP-dependent serine protease
VATNAKKPKAARNSKASAKSSQSVAAAPAPARELEPLEKSATGIPGLDEITGGGLPKGRTTIVCGGPGCGKTMLGIEFLVRGATDFNEPGVLMAFEETPEDMAKNVASLGFDLEQLAAKKNWPSITSTSSRPRFRRPATTTWKVCLSACRPPWTKSAPSA